MQNKGAVFLDRDGVVIEEVNYLSEVEQVRLIPGAAEAIANLNLAGLPVVVVTNQAGVARGYFPEYRVGEIHSYLDELLAECGAWVDRYYYCPHHPEAAVAQYRMKCDCRKPMPGMLHRAATEMGIDLAGSILVGDKASDLAAAGAAGCRSILVRTGHGGRVDTRTPDPKWNLLGVTTDLNDAIRHLLPELVDLVLKKSA